MSNPSPPKPSPKGVFSSSATLGPNCRCMIDVNQGTGALYDQVNGIVARRDAGIVFENRFGPAGLWVPNGFAGGYTYRQGIGNPSLSFDGSGFATGAGWNVGPKTLACTFMHTMPEPTNALWGAAVNAVGIWTIGGDTSASGIGIDYANRLCLLKGQNLSNGLVYGRSLAVQPLLKLLPGRQYSVVMPVDESTTPKTRWCFVYDHTAQAEMVYSGYGGAYDTVALTNTVGGVQGTAAPTSNSPTLFASLGMTGMDFKGELYAAGLWDMLFAHSDFVNYYQDPVSNCRATSTSAGNLRVFLMRVHDVTPTSIEVTAGLPTGTGSSGGSGVADLELWSGTTAAGMARVDNVAGVTKTNNGSTIDFVDARPGLAYGYSQFYQVIAVDPGSTERVPSNYEHAGILRNARGGALGWCGTSLSQKLSDANNIVFFPGALLRAKGYAQPIINRGGFGSRVSDWFIGATNYTTTAVWSLQWDNGTPTASTSIQLTGIDPTVGAAPGTAWTTAVIAYNSTAAQVQTAINNALIAIGSSGSVTCTGGPWPTAIVCTAAGAWALRTIPSSMTVAPGYAVTGTGATIPGAPPFLNCVETTVGVGHNLWACAVAEWTAAGCSDFLIEHLTNEALNSVSAATAISDLITLVNQFLTTFPSLTTITLVDSGGGWLNPGFNLGIVATGGTGSGFAGHVVVGPLGTIIGAVVDAPGAYTVAPTLSLTGVTVGSGATFTAVLGGGGVASITIGNAGVAYGPALTQFDFENQYRAAGVLAAVQAGCSNPAKVVVGPFNATANHANFPDLTSDFTHPVTGGAAIEADVFIRNLMNTYEPPAMSGGTFATGLKTGGRL